MDKTKVIQLSEKQRQELAEGYRSGANHAFRERCQMILLKSEKRSSREIARLLGCRKITVHGWVKRFEAEGTKGLKTRVAGNFVVERAAPSKIGRRDDGRPAR